MPGRSTRTFSARWFIRASPVLPVPIRTILRIEGAVIGGFAILLYAQTDAGWLWFALLILAPDLSMLGYLRGPRAGARVYNAAHTLIVPAALSLVGLDTEWLWAIPLGFIWAAHIGIDRAVGYGLKDVSAFRRTHLN